MNLLIRLYVWCSGVHRRWYVGFSQASLRDYLSEDASHKAEFNERRCQDIEQFKLNPHAKVQAVSHAKTVKKSLKSGVEMIETFELGRDLVWTERESYVKHFGQQPGEVGLVFKYGPVRTCTS